MSSLGITYFGIPIAFLHLAINPYVGLGFFVCVCEACVLSAYDRKEINNIPVKGVSKNYVMNWKKEQLEWTRGPKGGPYPK